MTKTQWYIGAPNGVVLCIDSAEETRLRGELWHSYSRDAVPFLNAQQMVLEMEKLYDLLNFPHPGTNERSFGPAKEASTGRTAVGRAASPGWRRTRPSISAPCGRWSSSLKAQSIPSAPARTGTSPAGRIRRSDRPPAERMETQSAGRF